MLINKAVSYLLGTLTVELRGGFTAEFIDEAIQSGLELYNIRYTDGALLFSSKPGTYKSLRTIAKIHQCRMRIRKKHGFVFTAKRKKCLFPVIAAAAVYFATLYLLGLFVINISVSGNYIVDAQTARDLLADNGVTFLAPRKELNIPSIERGLMAQNSDLSWVSLNLSYGSALLEISEKKLPPESEYRSEFKTAISSNDAVVSSIELKSGNALVNVGDVVREGQLIAASGDAMSGHSWVAGINGEIKGLVDCEISKNYKANAIERRFSGRKATLYIPSAWEIDIMKVTEYLNYDYYDISIKEIPILLFNVKLPFTLKAVTIREILQQDSTLSENEMLADFMMFLESQEALIDGDIVSREITSETHGSNHRFISRYTVQKNILSLG